MSNKLLIINEDYTIPIKGFNESIEKDGSIFLLNFGVTLDLAGKNNSSSFLVSLAPYFEDDSIQTIEIQSDDEVVFSTNQYNKIEGSSISLDELNELFGSIGFSKALSL